MVSHGTGVHAHMCLARNHRWSPWSRPIWSACSVKPRSHRTRLTQHWTAPWCRVSAANVQSRRTTIRESHEFNIRQYSLMLELKVDYYSTREFRPW